MVTFECVTFRVVSRAEAEEDIVLFSLIAFFSDLLTLGKIE
jgi:hypothetical protein